MARNPELDHEFNENKQEKPLIFVSGDMNFQPGGGAPKLTKGDQLGELAANGNAKTGLKPWQQAAIIIGAMAVAAIIYTLIYFHGDYFALRNLLG